MPRPGSPGRRGEVGRSHDQRRHGFNRTPDAGGGPCLTRAHLEHPASVGLITSYSFAALLAARAKKSASARPDQGTPTFWKVCPTGRDRAPALSTLVGPAEFSRPGEARGRSGCAEAGGLTPTLTPSDRA